MIESARSLPWARGYIDRAAGEVYGTQVATYRLTDLVARGFIDSREGRSLLLDLGLTEFLWQVVWADDDALLADELEFAIGGARGYSVFIHGWTGNHTIWENLPGMVVSGNPQMVALVVDHNGFGQSRFADSTPPLDTCNPPAAMRAVERLVGLLRLRRQPGDSQPRVINFIGHSMGGAALFYLNPVFWNLGEETRYAVAPALLLEDDLHRAFYTALGLGIGLVNRVRALEIVERAVKPNVVDALCAGASDHVRRAHALQYDETPRGVTSRTFAAMGMLNNREIARKWDLFRVMLGHRDALVGLVPMMDLLSALEFPPGHLRVVAGTHYMFSVGRDAVFQHAQNRELLIADLSALHQQAYQRQLSGARIG